MVGSLVLWAKGIMYFKDLVTFHDFLELLLNWMLLYKLTIFFVTENNDIILNFVKYQSYGVSY